VHLVGPYYVIISRCTVLRMSNLVVICFFLILHPQSGFSVDVITSVVDRASFRD